MLRSIPIICIIMGKKIPKSHNKKRANRKHTVGKPLPKEKEKEKSQEIQEKKEKCPRCARYFLDLEQHLNENACFHICFKCGEDFTCVRNLRRHERICIRDKKNKYSPIFDVLTYNYQHQLSQSRISVDMSGNDAPKPRKGPFKTLEELPTRRLITAKQEENIGKKLLLERENSEKAIEEQEKQVNEVAEMKEQSRSLVNNEHVEEKYDGKIIDIPEDTREYSKHSDSASETKEI